MSNNRPTNRATQRTIAAKLDPEQVARFERAVAAAGMSRSEFVRAAVLRQMVPLRPFDPLMADAIATLALCRQQARTGAPASADIVDQLERLINALHRASDATSR